MCLVSIDFIYLSGLYLPLNNSKFWSNNLISIFTSLGLDSFTFPDRNPSQSLVSDCVYFISFMNSTLTSRGEFRL